MPIYVLEEGDFMEPIPEDTILGAEVVEVNALEREGATGKYNRVNFKFVVRETGSDWDGEFISGETPDRFNTHPDCKLANWAQAIANTKFPPGYSLDTDFLIGMKCRIVTAHRKYQKDGQDRIWCHVGTVLPARTQSTGASDF